MAQEASRPKREASCLFQSRAGAAGQASVSIFDAEFVLGDGVWEGLRLDKRACGARLVWGFAGSLNQHIVA